jgi:hypothetical protein
VNENIGHTLKLKTGVWWNQFYKSPKKSNDIPSIPSPIYENKGWIRMADWLGTGTI